MSSAIKVRVWQRYAVRRLYSTHMLIAIHIHKKGSSRIVCKTAQSIYKRRSRPVHPYARTGKEHPRAADKRKFRKTCVHIKFVTQSKKRRRRRRRPKPTITGHTFSQVNKNNNRQRCALFSLCLHKGVITWNVYNEEKKRQQPFFTFATKIVNILRAVRCYKWNLCIFQKLMLIAYARCISASQRCKVSLYPARAFKKKETNSSIYFQKLLKHIFTTTLLLLQTNKHKPLYIYIYIDSMCLCFFF